MFQVPRCKCRGQLVGLGERQAIVNGMEYAKHWGHRGKSLKDVARIEKNRMRLECIDCHAQFVVTGVKSRFTLLCDCGKPMKPTERTVRASEAWPEIEWACEFCGGATLFWLIESGAAGVFEETGKGLAQLDLHVRVPEQESAHHKG